VTLTLGQRITGCQICSQALNPMSTR
jgi:hypothetical protein